MLITLGYALFLCPQVFILGLKCLITHHDFEGFIIFDAVLHA